MSHRLHSFLVALQKGHFHWCSHSTLEFPFSLDLCFESLAYLQKCPHCAASRGQGCYSLTTSSSKQSQNPQSASDLHETSRRGCMYVYAMRVIEIGLSVFT